MKNAILESFDGNIWNQMFVKSMEKKKCKLTFFVVNLSHYTQFFLNTSKITKIE